MKKTFTSFALMLISSLSFAQITITSSDVPVPSSPFNLDDFSSATPPSPGSGANQTWNYSTFFGNTPTTNNFPVETNSFFTGAGIDVRNDNFKSFNATFGYNVSSEFDFSATGVAETGLFVPAQAYSLNTITGNPADSLVMASQQYLLSSPKWVMKFPMTANTAWQSSSPRIADFTLTVAAYSLNHAPAQHRYTVIRKDSIAGWGKLSVYTSFGPSVGYDVLMDKVGQYAVDSFYLNGAPAPAPLLSAFSVSQGQQSDKQYFYSFYRKGSFNYLMRLSYGSDNTYTTLSGAFVNTDNLVVTDMDDVKAANYSTLIFPNPSNGSEVNVKLIGKAVSSTNYFLIDMMGRVVAQGKPEMQGGDFMRLVFPSALANGNYVLHISDQSNKELLREQITVQR